jgi:hypothetical protein
MTYERQLANVFIDYVCESEGADAAIHLMLDAGYTKQQILDEGFPEDEIEDAIMWREGF